MKSLGFHEANLHSQVKAGPEVVVKPSFSISDLSFLIMAAQNDQSVTTAEMTLHANGMRLLLLFGQSHKDFASSFNHELVFPHCIGLG